MCSAAIDNVRLEETTVTASAFGSHCTATMCGASVRRASSSRPCYRDGFVWALPHILETFGIAIEQNSGAAPLTR
jgi:hypothetical protein